MPPEKNRRAFTLRWTAFKRDRPTCSVGAEGDARGIVRVRKRTIKAADKFSGNRGEVVKQIGNSVPVRMARSLCVAMLEDVFQ